MRSGRASPPGGERKRRPKKPYTPRLLLAYDPSVHPMKTALGRQPDSDISGPGPGRSEPTGSPDPRCRPVSSGSIPVGNSNWKNTPRRSRFSFDNDHHNRGLSRMRRRIEHTRQETCGGTALRRQSPARQNAANPRQEILGREQGRIPRAVQGGVMTGVTRLEISRGRLCVRLLTERPWGWWNGSEVSRSR